jgi:hypothetical protein
MHFLSVFAVVLLKRTSRGSKLFGRRLTLQWPLCNAGAEQLRIEALSKTSEDILSELISKTGSSDERHCDYLNPEWARKKAAA